MFFLVVAELASIVDAVLDGIGGGGGLHPLLFVRAGVLVGASVGVVRLWGRWHLLYVALAAGAVWRVVSGAPLSSMAWIETGLQIVLGLVAMLYDRAAGFGEGWAPHLGAELRSLFLSRPVPRLPSLGSRLPDARRSLRDLVRRADLESEGEEVWVGEASGHDVQLAVVDEVILGVTFDLPEPHIAADLSTVRAVLGTRPWGLGRRTAQGLEFDDPTGDRRAVWDAVEHTFTLRLAPASRGLRGPRGDARAAPQTVFGRSGGHLGARDRDLRRRHVRAVGLSRRRHR